MHQQPFDAATASFQSAREISALVANLAGMDNAPIDAAVAHEGDALAALLATPAPTIAAVIAKIRAVALDFDDVPPETLPIIIADLERLGASAN